MTDFLDPATATRAPRQAADDAGAHALLACWLRELPGWGLETLDDRPVVVVPLPGWNGRLLVRVRRVSATFRHQLELPALIQLGDAAPRPISLAPLAVLLADALDDVPGRGDALLSRVLDSAAAVADHLTRRAADIDRLWSAAPLPFGESEQALLLGHLVHPTPKSRGEMSAVERLRYSPEPGGRFPLRWLAVAADLVRHASALETPAPRLAEALLRDDPAVDPAALDATLKAVGDDRVLLPAHPYEADRLAAAPETAGLFASGDVVDLGPWGSPYLPTTSVRTVYRAAAPWQLKFSLHVRVTNSMRVTLPKELDRAVESARLARTVVGQWTAAAAPDLVLVQDPAYLTVARGDEVLNGFSVLLRSNRWGVDGPPDVTALTTLCQDHPYGGHSRLAALVAAIADRSGRAEHEVAREWFGRFCDVVVRSLVRLYLEVGLCFEAHQQNTLVELEDGWPVRGVYRDSQGYFHREAAHGDLVAVVPGLGEATESLFPEALADERLVYYLFVNLTLGVVNALGPCVDETALLSDLRRVLTTERSCGGRYPATLLDRLLDDDRWPCKANLLTRANDMDELVGDISTQSVYVTLPNPLLGVAS
ncbi:IucA/IucC family protein [Jiangella asiatica]|uniref:IucA/IucC family siderophore biosynthesis protein n=1 Tax=Jiangella asiatica TaxID=2530372 RepID=A0A4R5DGC9_9ACTN|nr:IucA/IucC family protein [Jiangella asiatica]TDE13072.1 IucA/IucC family siderophore biosynthesis protein [Jiangella asiatica]